MLRKRPFFGIMSNSPHIFPKFHPISCLITHPNHPKQRESLENKGFLLLSNISRSNSTERHFVKSYFNYFIFVNSPIIVDFLRKFTFYLLRTELFTESIFIPFHKKRSHSRNHDLKYSFILYDAHPDFHPTYRYSFLQT